MSSKPTIHIISPHQLEIHWPPEISERILLEMISCKNYLMTQLEAQVCKLSMGYHVLAVFFQLPGKLSERKRIVTKALNEMGQVKVAGRKRWEFPVCYEETLAQDLEYYCQFKAMDKQEVIHLHSNTNYLLHFYGFLPGFMYLGGLNECLHLARKEKPDHEIPAGSVAIGGQQTGVYPLHSPGGWHVIGKTPLSLVQRAKLPPFQPGDEISFTPISKAVFDSWSLTNLEELHYELI